MKCKVVAYGWLGCGSWCIYDLGEVVMSSKARVCNILARGIIQELLHQILLRDVATQCHRWEAPRPRKRFSYSSISSSSSPSPTFVSSSSTDSFFKGGIVRAGSPVLEPDPDHPSFDGMFSRSISQKSFDLSSAKSKVSASGFRRRPRPPVVAHERDAQFQMRRHSLAITPPRSKSIAAAARGDTRRNAVVNQLQRTVTFPRHESIKWPSAKLFTAELGRQRIIELIEKTWNYSPILTYVLDFENSTGSTYFIRYRYTARWRSPMGRLANVFFNIDVPRGNTARPVSLTYTFQSGKIVHKPHTSNYHHQWLRNLEKA